MEFSKRLSKVRRYKMAYQYDQNNKQGGYHQIEYPPQYDQYQQPNQNNVMPQNNRLFPFYVADITNTESPPRTIEQIITTYDPHNLTVRPFPDVPSRLSQNPKV